MSGKIQQDVFVDDEKMISTGFSLASKCCICQQDQDSMAHLLWDYIFSRSIWTWLGNIFNFPNPFSFVGILKFVKNKSPIVKEAWLTAALSTMRELWFQKNNIMFDNGKPNENNFKKRILNLVHYEGYRMHGARWGQVYDSNILNFFNLSNRRIRFQAIKECYWSSPKIGYVLFCCDGAAAGNPGIAGFGIITRGCNCEVIGTVSGGLGITTNYIAETLEVI
ncbi:uncharacterized protein LOC113335563 [Papaver somniferum]|uniref:uncharacterized protein LOC113335563 n=1 Tax=Papaver somniferum TaxID=3469 RepID=UPI000E70217D|nr:uncharacterized protein LOC113335563 [Papaver somniferum]